VEQKSNVKVLWENLVVKSCENPCENHCEKFYRKYWEENTSDFALFLLRLKNGFFPSGHFFLKSG
jgi:hypothetical protein